MYTMIAQPLQAGNVLNLSGFEVHLAGASCPAVLPW